MAKRKITPFGRLFLVLAITGGLYFGYVKVQEVGGLDKIVNVDTKDLVKKTTKPGDVVAAIFDAARNKNFSQLAEFCHTDGSADGDVKSICFLDTASEKEQSEFVKSFKFGQVIGKPVVAGNEAKVQIKYGPNGDKDGTISLTQKDGQWYLSSF